MATAKELRHHLIRDDDAARYGGYSSYSSSPYGPGGRQSAYALSRDGRYLAENIEGAHEVPVIDLISDTVAARLPVRVLGGFSSDAPIHFWNNPVGSTSSIVSMCYQQLGIPVPPPIAGLLMAGIISDTLNLTRSVF